MDGQPSNRVLIIGARGVFGQVAARAFTSAGWKVRRGARHPRPGQVAIDLDRPDSIAANLDVGELVLNTVPHPSLLAERHVLERGGVLINTSALPAAAGRSLRAVAGGATGTVLMNAGLAPGVTSVVAADLLRVHPDADELEIVCTLSVASPRGPASADFIHRGLTTVSRHRTAWIPLPPPFGTRRCLGFGEDDAGWLGGVAEGRMVRVYLCIAEPAAHQQLLELNGEGAMTKLRRSPIGARRLPERAAPSDEPVAHWIAAKRNGRRLAARTVECRGDFVHAAHSTLVFADALLAHEASGGCFDPEEICAAATVEARLRTAGITIVARGVGDGGAGDRGD
jgi:hypothetical protein